MLYCVDSIVCFKIILGRGSGRCQLASWQNLSTWVICGDYLTWLLMKSTVYLAPSPGSATWFLSLPTPLSGQEDILLVLPG